MIEPPPGPVPQPDPVSPAAGPRLAERIGLRLTQRPEPRFGVALAGIGAVMMVGGAGAWGGNYATHGGAHKLLGIGLTLAVIVAGYTVAIRARTGPLVTAGVTATAVGVPLLIGFLSLSTGSSDPISFDAIAIVSMIVWLISYTSVPVVRGHVFYLGATLVTFWIYLLDKIEPHLFSLAYLFPYFGAGDTFDSTVCSDGIIYGSGDGSGVGLNPVPDPDPCFSSSDSGPDFPGVPSLVTVAVVSLILGLVYYAIAFSLDRSAKAGVGIAFVVAGFPTTVFGLVAASSEMPAAGAGALVIVVGALVGAAAARSRRRFTTWVGAGAVGIGIVAILGDIVDDNTAAGGISLIVIGAVLVAGSRFVTSALKESDDLPPPDSATSAA